MRNLKKLLSVLVAVAMMVTLVIPAFAADPKVVSDGIEDLKVKAAVEKLVTFGIVSGMEDGKYHPEANVTRDQFAKLVVEALGMGSAAMQGATSFSDVPASKWSSGYVRVASGAGLIKGYTNGKFGPDDNVTYAQAVTILVRALGYKDEFLKDKGSWPGNYLAQAAESGITKGVKIGAGDTVNRGAVAVMLSNALDANVVERDQYGDESTWKENDNETLLYNKLSITKVENAVVTGTPKVVDISADQIQTYVDPNDYDAADPASDYEGTEILDVVNASIDVNSLLGLSLNVYINDDDEVIYAEESSNPYEVVYDVIDDGEDVTASSITLVNKDTEYDFAANAKVYVDNDVKTIGELAGIVGNDTGEPTVYGKFVFDDKGSIILADLMQFDGDEAMIVTGVDKDAKEITYNVDDAEDQDVLALEADYDRYAIYDTNGKALDISEVQKDDIIYLNDEDKNGDALKEKTNNDEVAYVVVVRAYVTGKIDSYSDDEVEIDNKTYDWTNGATESMDEDGTYSLIGTADADSDLNDASADEVDVVGLLDMVGDVRHLRGSSDVSSDDLYSIVTGVDSRYSDVYIKVMGNENDEIEYYVDADFNAATTGYASDNDIREGDLVKYTLNSDGNIDQIWFLGALNDGGTDFTVDTANVERGAVGPAGNIDAASDNDINVAKGTVTDDFSAESIEIGGNDRVVSNSIQALDITAAGNPAEYDLGDAEFADYTKLVDKSGAGTGVLYVQDDNDDVVFIAFLAGFDAADDEQAGYLLERRTKDGDPQVDIILPSGEKVRYIVDDASSVGGASKVVKESVVLFEVTQSGKIDVLSSTASADYETVTGVVYNIDGKHITIADATGAKIGTYRLATNNTIWMTDGEERSSTLKEGESLVTIAVKNGLIEVIKIYDVGDGTLDTEGEAVKFFDTYDGAAGVDSFDDLYNDTGATTNGKYDLK